MEIVIVADGAAVAARAAQIMAWAIRAVPQPVIGVATGSSPLGIYRELAAQVRAGELDVSNVTAFALDEYIGLAPSHPESYHHVIDETVTKQLGLDPARVHVPNGHISDILTSGDDYERAIVAAGGIDIQLLGIGANGHIGFNEPASSFASRTRMKTLAPQTREDNARFFGSIEEVPVHCITQGLGTILDAGQLLLVAQGESKADAVAAMIEGPVASMCPASALQLHRFATVVIDEAAASKLQLGDYYRHVQQHRGAITA
ncbi:glucosamine-6-phosphate deaminase [Leucobacter exalbidus]|uniref:Glucosamine-6-phosphate deaminase n=1 Tax=Leucobacter exalbidus TaxID=662960 RepID=A0A940PU42_9MICO|nr:glucosamine-6-phosphate deaminase [Leucobacter exalbidus]MBP1326967.1 glucosamine-6-phosphate deaminase [Leucobacter exalbidus]